MEPRPNITDYEISDSLQLGSKTPSQHSTERDDVTPEVVDIDLTDPKVTQAAVLLQAGFRGLKTRSKFKSKVGFLHDSARLSHEMHNFTTVTFDNRQFCTNFSPCLPPFKSTTVQSMWYQQLSYLHDVFPLVSCVIFPSIQSLF